MPTKEKRRLRVLLETHEVTTVSFKRNHLTAVFCQWCQTDTLRLTITESATILKLSELEIFRFVETNQIHSIETDGMIRVCGNSLSAIEQGRATGSDNNIAPARNLP